MLQFDSLDGAILVDKPTGCTSHDVVDRVRRKFGLKKVGHCGTLDPNATGLLILVLGRGTKLSEKLMSDDKVYEGDIKFGEATDSYDADGEVTATAPVPPLTLEQLNEAAATFLGDLQQVPPMVSAKKQGGVALDVLVGMLILGVFFFEIRERFDSLTPREREVLTLVTRGKANKVMAGDLGVTRAAVWKAIERLRRDGYEIEAEAAGEIVKIHPQNGQPVQYGERLFAIKPTK